MLSKCKFCGLTFKNEAALTTHLRTNKNCMKIQENLSNGAKFDKEEAIDYDKEVGNSKGAGENQLVKKDLELADKVEQIETEILAKRNKQLEAKVKELESEVEDYTRTKKSGSKGWDADYVKFNKSRHYEQSALSIKLKDKGLRPYWSTEKKLSRHGAEGYVILKYRDVEDICRPSILDGEHVEPDSEKYLSRPVTREGMILLGIPKDDYKAMFRGRRKTEKTLKNIEDEFRGKGFEGEIREVRR